MDREQILERIQTIKSEQTNELTRLRKVVAQNVQKIEALVLENPDIPSEALIKLGETYTRVPIGSIAAAQKYRESLSGQDADTLTEGLGFLKAERALMVEGIEKTRQEIKELKEEMEMEERLMELGNLVSEKYRHYLTYQSEQNINGHSETLQELINTLEPIIEEIRQLPFHLTNKEKIEKMELGISSFEVAEEKYHWEIAKKKFEAGVQ